MREDPQLNAKSSMGKTKYKLYFYQDAFLKKDPGHLNKLICRMARLIKKGDEVEASLFLVCRPGTHQAKVNPTSAKSVFVTSCHVLPSFDGKKMQNKLGAGLFY